jgi:hypothetical protein
MTSRPSINTAIEHLRLHRIVFEAGLTDAEITKVEEVCGSPLPPDFRLFLQTALPVTGGFPNWRSESENNLRRRYLDRPARGILFDVEHNDFWHEVWGPRPADLSDALTEAKRRLAEAPPLLPFRSHDFLLAEPSAEGNPVFSVRQTDISCVGRDLPSYLTGLFEPDGHANALARERVDSFWTHMARMSRVRVPNLAGPVLSGAEQDCSHLCRVAQSAGFWGEVLVLPLGPGRAGVTFDRREPTGGRKHGRFSLSRRDFGWLLCFRGPRFYFAPDAERIAQLCLALINDLPHEGPHGERPPSWEFTPGDDLRREFGLVAIQDFTAPDDERGRELRAWERLGWREMSKGQRDEAWGRYRERFGDLETDEYITPAPSTTWDVSPAYLRDDEHTDRLEGDLTLKARNALKQCTPPGEDLLALDWFHACYFFDPHAGVSAAHPPSWPVSVLPTTGHHIFLARDFRFGVVGNCVDRTVCVFGRELLSAFAADPPSAFNKPTWTCEGRRGKQRLWADLGWQRLAVVERSDVLGRFDSLFGFLQRKKKAGLPAIMEPTPSLTWAIAPGHDHSEAEAADLTLKLLGGFQRAARPGERLYALDSLRWHEHNTFDPRRLRPAGRDSRALTLYPDDNYTIFLAADLRFGVFGNPLEKTLCLFGGELLEAMGNDLPVVFAGLVRRNGRAISI